MDEASPIRAEPSWVRPYTLTAGRTEPSVHLPLEALVETRESGQQHRWPPTDMREEIVKLCADRPSVAEIASQLDVPLGVARVLVADLVVFGYLRVLSTLDEASTENRRELIGRTLRGLRAL